MDSEKGNQDCAVMEKVEEVGSQIQGAGDVVMEISSSQVETHEDKDSQDETSVEPEDEQEPNGSEEYNDPGSDGVGSEVDELDYEYSEDDNMKEVVDGTASENEGDSEIEEVESAVSSDDPGQEQNIEQFDTSFQSESDDDRDCGSQAVSHSNSTSEDERRSINDEVPGSPEVEVQKAEVDKDDEEPGSPSSSVNSAGGDRERTEPDFVCAYKKYGCLESWSDPYSFKLHIGKPCKYSLLEKCRHSLCRYSGTGTFPNLKEFVFHSIDQHLCQRIEVTQGVTRTNIIPLERYFPKPAASLEHDTDSKICAFFENEEYGEAVCVAWLVVAGWNGNETDKLYFLPVMFGDGEYQDHFVRIQFEVAGQGNEFLSPKTGFVVAHENPDRAPVLVRAYGVPKEVFTALTKAEAPSFMLSEFISKVYSNALSTYNMYFTFSVTIYRCKVLRQSGFEPVPYPSTLEEIPLRPQVREELMESIGNVPPALFQILWAQLQGHADLIVECNDEDGIFITAFSAFVDYAIRTRRESDEPGKRKTVAVVFYPCTQSLSAAENKWRLKGSRVGVFVSTLSSLREGVISNLQSYGCEVLLTTTSLFLEALAIENADLGSTFFPNLKYMLLLDADYGIREDGLNKFRECVYSLPDDVTPRILSIAVSPVVTKQMVNRFYSHGFLFQANVISLGLKAESECARMDMDVRYIKRISSKQEAVMDLLAYHEDEDRRWLIFVTEDVQRCPGHYETLVADLVKKYGNLVASVPNREALEENPNAMEPFRANPRGILVTSYSSLIYDALSSCTAILLHTMPVSKADLRRVSKLSVDARGYQKLCVGFTDKYVGEVKEMSVFDEE